MAVAATTNLIAYLEKFFQRRPDLKNTINTIFVTHTHIDHNRSLKDVVQKFKVQHYVHNGVLQGSGRGAANWMIKNASKEGRNITLRAVSQKEISSFKNSEALSDKSIDPVDCSDADPVLKVLAAPYEENPGWPQGEFRNGNNKSLVIRVDLGKSSFLFTGDLEEHAIETLVEHYDGTAMLDVDVYQVGHHGSHNGTTESLMKAMTPEIAVFSMGKSTDRKSWTAYAYGHPRVSVVKLLDKWIDRRRTKQKYVNVADKVKSFIRYRMRDAIYGTGWEGTVVVKAGADGVLEVE